MDLSSFFFRNSSYGRSQRIRRWRRQQAEVIRTRTFRPGAKTASSRCATLGGDGTASTEVCCALEHSSAHMSGGPTRFQLDHFQLGARTTAKVAGYWPCCRCFHSLHRWVTHASPFSREMLWRQGYLRSSKLVSYFHCLLFVWVFQGVFVDRCCATTGALASSYKWTPSFNWCDGVIREMPPLRTLSSWFENHVFLPAMASSPSSCLVIWVSMWWIWGISFEDEAGYNGFFSYGHVYFSGAMTS